jgi:hypothetical protein
MQYIEKHKLPEREEGSKSLTVKELGELCDFKVCEACSNYDLDIGKCSKGYRPKRYSMYDGPNEEAHVRKKCKDYKEAETTYDWEFAVTKWLES